jgi:hypothetical protein
MTKDRSDRRQWTRHLTVLAAYFILALALTYPLVLYLTTHVPGDGRDDPPLVWNLWWVGHALLDLHSNPLTCSYMFYPIGVNLTFFTLTILNAFLSVPLQMAAGVVLASNANLLLSYTVAGFGMYLLALDVLAGGGERRSRFAWAAAFVAGLVYAFAPIKMIFASLGQFNMTSTQWLPFCVLYLLRTARPPLAASPAAAGPVRFVAAFFPPDSRRGLRSALLAALFLLLTAYAEFTFASFLGMFLAVYLAYLFATHRDILLTRWMFGRLAVIGLVFVVGFWPILGSMLREMAIEGDYSLTAGWGFADVFVADLLGFFLPSRLHPLLGGLAQEVERSFSYTNFASVGIVVFVLAAVGLWARRRGSDGRVVAPASFWGLSALLYAILSLGPVLHIAGRWVFDLDGLLVRVPLPFIILHYIPFIKANRYPSRLHVLVILCLAVLVAYGVQAILGRTQTNADKTQGGAEHSMSIRRDRPRLVSVRLRSFLAFLMVGALLFEYLAVPLPLSDLRTPQVYRTIAQDNAHAPVLQLPISWRNSFQFIPQSFTALPQEVNTVVMFQQFYQTTHQGPILSGNTSRNPEFKFTYFLQAPVIRSIIALQEGRTVSPQQVADDRSLMPDVLRLLSFKYIVLHPPLVGGPVEEYIRAVFPVEPIPADAGLSAYRVIAPPAVDRLVIDMGSDLSNLYRAEGWGEPQVVGGRTVRWSDRQRARILLPLQDDRALTLTIEGLFPVTTEHAQNEVRIILNGRVLETLRQTPAAHTLSVQAAAGIARAGINDLVIEKSKLDSLQFWYHSEAGLEPRPNIVAHSAGLDAGGDLGFAHIYVNGKDAITGRRGFNVAVIDPGSGRVERTARFDVLGDPAANGAFLDFIKATQDGRIVAVAVMDDASINLDESSLAALRLIGAQTDLRGRLRNSYAAIGAKGGAPGSALEQFAQGRPASVAVGAHVFGRGLGVAVSHVTVETR